MRTRETAAFVGTALLLLLLCSIPAPAGAFTIVSSVQNVVQLNGILYTNTTLTVICSLADFDTNITFSVVSDNGTASTVIVNCNSPERQYIVSLYGYIPDDGELFTSEVCTVQNTIRYTTTNGSAILPPISFTGGVKLLSFEDTDIYPDSMVDPAGRKLTGVNSASGVESSLVDVICSGSWAGFIPFIGAPLAGASYGSSFNPGDPGGCSNSGGGGVSQAAFDTLNGTVDVLSKAFNTYKNAQIALNNANKDAIGNFSIFEADQLAYNNNTLNKIAAVQAQVNVTQSAVNFLGVQLTADLDVLNGQIGVLAGNTASLGSQLIALANGTAGAIATLASELANQTALTNIAVAQLNTITQNNYQTMLQMNRATQQSILAINGVIKAIYLDTTNQNAQNVQIQAKIAKLANFPDQFGNTLTPFLEDIGSPPAANPLNLGAQFSNVQGEIISQRYIVGSGNTATAYNTQFSISCTPIFLVLSQFNGMTWRDIVDTWGPDACVPGAQGNGRCNCYVQVQLDARCSLPTSGGSITPSGLTNWLGSNGISSGACSGNTVDAGFSGNLNGVIITNLVNLTNDFAIIASRGNYTGQQIQMLSLNGNQQDLVNWDSRVLHPGNFTTLMLPQTAADVFNVYYSFMNLLVFSFEIVTDNLDNYATAIFGGLPNYMTQSTTLFRRFTVGSSGRCTSYSMMSYSNYFLTVSIPTLNQIITNVQIWIDNTTSSALTTVLSNPFSDLAPTNQAFVWDPAFSDSKIWNTDVNDVTTAPFATKRCGDLLYPVVANVTQFTRPIWQFINGEEFVHPCGSNVASAWEANLFSNPLDPRFGECSTAPIAPNGGWCLMRQHFRVLFFGIFNNPNITGTMILSDKDAIYTTTFNVPSGQIILTIGSSCPTVSAPVVAAGNQLIVRIGNPIASINRIRAQQTGGCPQTYFIDLPTSGYFDLSIFSCPNPGGLQEQLNFAYLVTGTQYQPCSTVVNVTIVPEAVILFTGPSTSQFVEQNRNYTASSLLLQIQEISSNAMAGLNANMAATFAALIGASPIPLPPAVYLNITSLVFATNAIVNSSNNVLLQTQQNQSKYNLTAGLIPYDNDWNAINERLNGLNNQSLVLMAKLEADNAIAHKNYLVEQAATAAANAALVNVTAALNAFMQALLNALNPANAAPGPGGPDFGSVAKFLAGVAGWTLNEAGQGFSALDSLAGGVIPSIGGMFGSSLGGITTTVVIIVIVVALICCLITVLPMCLKPGMPLASVGGTSSSTPAAIPPAVVAAAMATKGLHENQAFTIEELEEMEERLTLAMSKLEKLRKKKLKRQSRSKSKSKKRQASSSDENDDERKELHDIRTHSSRSDDDTENH